MKQHRLAAVLTVPGAIAAIVVVLMFIYGPLTDLAGGGSVRAIPDPKDKAAAINTVRQTLLATVAGAIALGGLLYSARTFYLTRRGHLTDRYARAIGLLGSDKTAERVGGVYALEHLMRESPVDHETIVDVLAAFIPRLPPAALAPSTALAPAEGDQQQPAANARGPRASALEVDVQAALTVLGRRPAREERNRLNLSFADLRGAKMLGANLSGARLHAANLRGANLIGANLSGANLLGADLTDAKLAGADMTDAKLGGVLPDGNFRPADLTRADLRGVNFIRADLRGATLTDAKLPEHLEPDHEKIAPDPLPQTNARKA